ncbi:TERB2 protein, partial [Halcyon senegalensis]|nr:TERB2 protein [Halcyon senegalensis]
MFRGHRAWFSQSVSPGPRELWAAGGGGLTHWRDAEYLFSSDAAHPDTRRIHESLDYLEGRATVFHSRYLSAWVSTSAGAKLSVMLGHFVLPPACLQEGQVKEKKSRFCSPGFPFWGCEGELPPNENLMDKPEPVGKSSKEEAEDMVDLAKSKEETGSRAPAHGEFLYRTLQEYPMSNMVTGYASARNMKKYVGELRDFTPGTSGYAVYWIQNEINLRSDARSATQKK